MSIVPAQTDAARPNGEWMVGADGIRPGGATAMVRYDSSKHHRRSIRLRSWDYRSAGAYFVTICTQHRDCRFGDIRGNEMMLNDAGQMVQTCWQQIRDRFAGIELDTWLVMPNHIHSILIMPDIPAVGAPLVGAQEKGDRAPTADTDVRQCPTVGEVVGAFKSTSTNLYIRGVREQGWPYFDRRLWQRNYYERVIRNERELNAIRQYILDNPANWEKDEENPHRRM
jgi:REP element-mobilizing transposase RayT